MSFIYFRIHLFLDFIKGSCLANWPLMIVIFMIKKFLLKLSYINIIILIIININLL